MTGRDARLFLCSFLTLFGDFVEFLLSYIKTNFDVEFYQNKRKRCEGMYKEYNPNPHGKRTGDCVIRAVSKAIGQSWEQTYLDLSLQGYLMGDVLSSNSVWGAYLKGNGFERDMVANDCPECYTIEDFCREYPKGTFVVGTGSHAVAVVDGDYYDAWNSGNEAPLYFYKKGMTDNVAEQH